MVKVILNPSIRRMSGKMGDWTFRWTHGQQTIMKTPDMSKVKWTKAQKAHRQRFGEAIAYARSAMADRKVRAYYEAAGKNLLNTLPPRVQTKGRT